MNGHEKIPIKEAIVVEGRYDKAKVSRLFDTIVLETGGFQIFRDKEKLALIRMLASMQGVILLTDGDGAGFVIRNFIKGAVGGQLRHAYIPDVYGKERRKERPSSEGKLGVEGIGDEAIVRAVLSAGALRDGEAPQNPITRLHLYEDGLSGGKESKARRKKLTEALGLPEHLSSSALCGVLNALMGYEQYKALLSSLFDG